MKIEVLNQWTLKTGLAQQSIDLKSAWMSSLLCAIIITSLLSVVYVKYENHRLYSKIKVLETRTHAAYRDHMVVSSQRVRNISYDLVHKHISRNKMVLHY